jgi:hypothetical protein
MRILVMGTPDYQGAQTFQHEMDLAAARLISEQEGRYLREGLVVVTGKAKSGADWMGREWSSKRMDTDLELIIGSSIREWAYETARGADLAMVFATACHRNICKGKPSHVNHVVDQRVHLVEDAGIPMQKYGWYASEARR